MNKIRYNELYDYFESEFFFTNGVKDVFSEDFENKFKGKEYLLNEFCLGLKILLPQKFRPHTPYTCVAYGYYLMLENPNAIIPDFIFDKIKNLMKITKRKLNYLNFSDRDIKKIMLEHKTYTVRKKCKYEIGYIVECADVNDVVFSKVEIIDIVKFIDVYPYKNISFKKKNGNLYSIPFMYELGYSSDCESHREYYNNLLKYLGEEKTGYLINFKVVKDK